MPVEFHRARIRVDSHVVRADVETVLEVRPPFVPGIRRHRGHVGRGERGPAGSHVGGRPGRDVLADRKDRQTNSDVRRGKGSDRLCPNERR